MSLYNIILGHHLISEIAYYNVEWDVKVYSFTCRICY